MRAEGHIPQIDVGERRSCANIIRGREFNIPEKYVHAEFFQKLGYENSLYLLLVINFLLFLENSVYIVAFKEIQDDLGFSDTQYGGLVANMRAFSAIWALIIMHSCALYPPCRIIAISFFLALVGNITIAVSSNYWLIFAAIIPKMACWTLTNVFVCLLDAYTPPEQRVSWIAFLINTGMIGGLIGVGIGSMCPWRITYLTIACTSIVGLILSLYIDGPLVLPRDDENAMFDPNICANVWDTCRIPRAFVGITATALFQSTAAVQVDFFAKFMHNEYDYDTDEATMMLAPIFVVAGIAGKYVGAKYMDHTKNIAGLGESSSSRKELYDKLVALGIPVFILYSIISGVGWYFGLIVFMITAGLLSFLVAFFPDYNLYLWSVPIDFTAYSLPMQSWIFSATYVGQALAVGGLLDSDISYPVTYSLITIVCGISVTLFSVEYFTDIIPYNYDLKLTGIERRRSSTMSYIWSASNDVIADVDLDTFENKDKTSQK